MSKRILVNPDSLPKILKGAQLVRQMVGATMGPNGRNCVYERSVDNLVLSTRDGVTVARQIELEDPHENMGAQMVRGVANEQVEECGDGTTLSVVLTESIFSGGMKAITVGANPVSIKRGIEKATSAVLEQLKSFKIDVKDNMLCQVATISANNDPFLGTLISSAMQKAGPDGVVVVEESRTSDSSLEMMDGVQFASGFLAPEFVTNEERKECVLEDVYILLYEKPLRQILPMKDILMKQAAEGKSFLVIAEDVLDEALGVLRVNAKALKCCAIKAPGGLEHLKDLAALTQGKVITESLGIAVKDIQPTYFGHAKKIVIRPGSTTIIADTATNPALTQRLQELRTQVSSAANEFDRDRLQARLAQLAGGVAIIKIGATTLLEMSEKKDRLEDSLHATRCAEKEGVVPGGGISLARASAVVDSLKLEGDEAVGAQILKKACSEPIRQIASNSGEIGDLVLRLALENPSPYGWNARTNSFEDLVKSGVLDPLKVVRMALQAAAGVAGLMLITETVIANPRSKNG